MRAQLEERKRFHIIREWTLPRLYHRPAMPFGNRKKYFKGTHQFSTMSQFKKYHPSGNLKFNNLGFFQSLKLRILMEKILSISLKLNSTPNTFGCYG